MNALELNSHSQCLELSNLFDKQMGLVKRETRFTSEVPAYHILPNVKEAAAPLGFDVKKNENKMKLCGGESGQKGPLSIPTEVFEVATSLIMVELPKAGGDTLELHKFYKNISTGLDDNVWMSGEEGKKTDTDFAAMFPQGNEISQIVLARVF
ncbi:hypothetical protein C5167_044780 [Papaver somniferum]|nr:hypothetical protein C5167_044780 [Papaver somniferum]